MKFNLSLERILTVGLGLVVVVFVIALATGNLTSGESSGAKPYVAKLAPVEFLYLDGPRIVGYLAQLEGGRVGAVHRISKEIKSVSGEASVTGAKVGAATQFENQADSTITRTEASALGLMLNDLAEDKEEGVELHDVKHIEKAADLDRIKEGWLVKFRTHDLLSPGYIRPYVVVSQSATLAALYGGLEDSELVARQKERAESFARQVGPDPRITFEVDPKPEGEAPAKAEEMPTTVLLPMRYRGLTSERSLLEKDRERYTGGNLTVIGKVIRRFPAGHRCEGDPERCQVQYTDFATREIWRHPLEQASTFLINHVSHHCKAPGKIEGRACYLSNLEEQTQLRSPGALILPLAVYK